MNERLSVGGRRNAFVIYFGRELLGLWNVCVCVCVCPVASLVVLVSAAMMDRRLPMKRIIHSLVENVVRIVGHHLGLSITSV